MSKKIGNNGDLGISIIGLGYVGLCTAVSFAERGLRVYGIEIDEAKRKKISSGVAPLHEPGLEPMLRSTLKSGFFSCSRDFDKAIKSSEITFLTVGTPSRATGAIDLQYIESAAMEVGHCLATKQSYHVVVVKSTVTPGTTEGVVRAILEEESGRKCGEDFGLCVNPEFLREGSAIDDTMNPDAVVIGSADQRATQSLIKLYERFYAKLPPTIVTTISSGEFVKYSVNTFRANQLSFLNTLANLCEKTSGADVVEVVRGLSTVTKIDPRYLRAGFGFGGSCLPKDLRALTARAKELDVDSSLLEASAHVNEKQPLHAVEMSRQLIGEIRGKRIAVLGLAFKAETDDVRESVAIKVANALADAGASVVAYDPQAMQNAREFLRPGIALAKDSHSCLLKADCCVIATEWNEFRKIEPKVFVSLMRTPAIVDGKRIFDGTKFKSAGIKLSSLGRNGPAEHEIQDPIVVGGRKRVLNRRLSR